MKHPLEGCWPVAVLFCGVAFALMFFAGLGLTEPGALQFGFSLADLLTGLIVVGGALVGLLIIAGVFAFVVGRSYGRR